MSRPGHLVACFVFFADAVGNCLSSREPRGPVAVAALPREVAAVVVTEPSVPPSEPITPPSLSASSQLPRGGREIFPRFRLVGYCGTPGAPKLGRLLGDLDARSKSIDELGPAYAREREPLAVFELIAVVATTDPGMDHKNRRRVPDVVVDRYLAAARRAKALLLLNIQPGTSDFLTEARHFEKYLREPDVGLALDPEWAMSARETPGKHFGQMTGATLNAVAEYLTGVIHDGDLPEKVLVFHQVNPWVLKNESVIAPHENVVLIKSVDGLGVRSSKIKTYDVLVRTMPSAVHAGMKLFFDEDTAGGHKLMTPEEVLALTPTPEYVMYE